MSHAVIPSSSQLLLSSLLAYYPPPCPSLLLVVCGIPEPAQLVSWLGAQPSNCYRVHPTSQAWHPGLAFRGIPVLCGDMAKPKSLVDLASTATSSTSHLPAHETRPRRPTPHAPSPRPSANLLALLATVAASSSSADGRPLSSDASPPDFLCPFLPPHFLADHTPSPRRDNAWDELYEDDRHHQGAPTPTRVRRRRRSGPLPDKYVEGVDGRWRKEHSWTLYGSSYCDVRINMSALPRRQY